MTAKIARALGVITQAAEAACSDPDIWCSVTLPDGFSTSDREFVATCNPMVVLALAQVARAAIALRGPHVSGVGLANAQEALDLALHRVDLFTSGVPR